MKRVISSFLAIVLILGVFAGCSSKKNDTNSNSNTQLKGDIITVSELKQKYGETDEGKLLPLYNLNSNEQLKISLKYTPTDEREVFSIHTDEKCLEESKVALMWSPSSYMPTGPKTYEVKPIMAPLSNSDTKGLWGNVSTYYIKFNYDIDAEKETKLEEPIIVPMSIKSPVEIPDTNYEIKDGNFTLTWSKVNGATSYKIYQRQKIVLFETVNIAPKGKEEAYVGNFPMLVKEVDANTFSYNDWLKDGNGGQSKIKSNETIGGYIISHQNQNVNGEYYVTAVVDGKESLFSMGVTTYSLNLPHSFASGASLLHNSYETVEDLPKSVNIEYVDGTVKQHNVTFTPQSGSKYVTYNVEGTSITGVVTVNSNADKIKNEPPKSKETGGFVKVENDIPQNAPTNVPTVNDGKTKAEDIKPNNKPTVSTSSEQTSSNESKPNTSTENKPNTDTESKPNTNTENKPNTDTENKNEEPTVIEQQKENTEKVVEEANKETVTVPDGMVVNASSAAEEYLAVNMIAGKTEISLAAFPEIQNWSILSDVLCEVVYQNPLILGVRQYGYDYGTMSLSVSYDYTSEEMANKQKEIMSEGKKIIESVITTDMSESAKRRAIYEYLEENTSYDDAALESAEKNNFQGIDDKYKDSFSTYGILVNKVGVCQSYAFTYDYLCELADVECITVTGDMMGYLPHAWNKVKIGDEWFVTDVTNNEKSLGIKDFMYENPDQIAYAFGYIEDDLYYTQDKVGIYKSTSTEYSKYKDCTFDSKDKLKTYIKNNAKAGATIELLATYENFDSDDVIEALKEANVSELGNSIIICGYVLFEIVK